MTDGAKVVVWREPGKLGTLATAQIGDYYAAVYESDGYPVGGFHWVVDKNGTEWPVPDGFADDYETAKERAGECLVERSAVADEIEVRVAQMMAELNAVYRVARTGRLQAGRDLHHFAAQKIALCLQILSDRPAAEWLEHAERAFSGQE